MKIGLIDVDGHSGFPNLALMRLSAYHKARGDEVEWCTPLLHYDRVYMSKVFTFSPDVDIAVQADEVVRGGTGYKDYGSLDARLITPEVARLLSRLHWTRFVRLSCDTEQMIPVIEQAVAYMREAGIAPSRFWAYMLVQDVEEAHRRALALDAMGVMPFAQPYRDYDGGEPTAEQKKFARWVNARQAFRSCRWEEFTG